MSAVVVDARGEQCPIPVVKATKAIEGMSAAGLLEVHVDNEIAVQNLLRMASGKGFAAKSEQVEEKHYLVTVDVDRPGGSGETAAEEAASQKRWPYEYGTMGSALPWMTQMVRTPCDPALATVS